MFALFLFGFFIIPFAKAEQTDLDPPTNVKAVQYPNGIIKISWQAPQSPVDGYLVYRNGERIDVYFYDETSNSIRYGGLETEVFDISLPASAETYTYQIYSFRVNKDPIFGNTTLAAPSVDTVSLSVDPTKFQLGDAIISKLAFNPATPKTNESFTIIATIKNIGEYPIDLISNFPVNSDFVFDKGDKNDIRESFQVTGDGVINPGEEINVTFFSGKKLFYSSPGQYQITACIGCYSKWEGGIDTERFYYTNIFRESKTNNNIFTATITVSENNDVTPPNPPTNITLSQSEVFSRREVFVEWDLPLDSDYSGVNIYRSTENNTLGNLITKGGNISFANVGKGFYNDFDIEDGKTYYYTLRAFDISGNESESTEQFSITTNFGPLTTFPEARWLVKNQKYVEVFYVDNKLQLHWIVDEQAAAKHFGPHWNRHIKVYDDLSDFNLIYDSNFTIDSERGGPSQSQALPGQLVKDKRYPEIYYIGDDKQLHWVVDESTAVKRFNTDWIKTVKTFDDLIYLDASYGDPVK